MKKRRPPIALVIHAGAGKLLPTKTREERARKALSRIADRGFEKLNKLSARDCVVWAVTQLENEPQFNAGTGGQLQSDGKARLTAALMDSEAGLFTGVVNVEDVRNPILIAKRLQSEKDRVLAGKGATNYARKHRYVKHNPVTDERWAEWNRKRSGNGRAESIFGTVGAVALDSNGRLAAATSTGGKGMEIVGRVSDSATVAGNYATSKAAVSATGIGEEIVDWALAARIVTRVDDGQTLERAFDKSFKEFRKMGGRAGAIGVDRKGKVMVQTTTPCILHAIRTPRVESGYP